VDHDVGVLQCGCDEICGVVEVWGEVECFMIISGDVESVRYVCFWMVEGDPFGGSDYGFNGVF
jgi:hypothetical protein